MQKRTYAPGRSILSTAALLAGLGVGASTLLAQTAGTTTPLGEPTAEPPQILERASQLLSVNRVWRAQQMLEPLTIRDGGAALSDAERERAFALLAAANKKLKSLDTGEVSLQKADLALEQGDLRSAEAHAGAVLRSGKASDSQKMRANEYRTKVLAARSAAAPEVRSALERAVEDFNAGRLSESKAALATVLRSGVMLTPEQAQTLETYQGRILELEQARGGAIDSTPVSGAAFQPGVVRKKDEPRPAQPPPAQPAAQPPAPPVEPVPPPPTEPPPAVQPPAEPPAVQPSQSDLIQASRKINAQSLRAEADRDYDAGLYGAALQKYSSLMADYSEFLTPEDQRFINDRIADAKVRTGANIQPPGDDIAQIIEQNRIIKQNALAEFRNQHEQARRALATGDTVKARDLAVSSRLTINNARVVFTEAEYEGYHQQVDQLLADIDRATQEAAAAEAARISAENLERQREQLRTGRAERDRKIGEAITRVRELQQQMDYKSALQVVNEQILFLDPINPAGLILRDILTDQLIFTTYHDLQRQKAVRVAKGQLDNQEATLYPNSIVDYPTDWPAISERRGEQLAFADSEENRRVRTVLNTKRQPVQFNGIALRDGVEWVRNISLVNVDVDWESLEAIGIQPESTVTLQLTNVSLRTILDRMLEKVSPDERSRAGWEINDGVLVIASEDVLRKNTPLIIYDIRDLLIQVPDYTNAPQFDLNSVLQNSGGSGGGGGGGQSPFRDTNQGQGAGGQGRIGGVDRRPVEDRVKDITDIIQQNVDVEGWVEQGGSTGAIHHLNGNLIIKNTPKNHQAISGLLAKLREARAMQINVETRFLLVSQDFFEQIGFDLDVYFNANNNQVRAARAIDPSIQASDFFNFATSPPGLQRAVTGARIDTDGDGTPDSFITQGVVPPNGFSPIGNQQGSLPLSNALLSGQIEESSVAGVALGAPPALGIAGQFLDDVQVDFLIQATQADRRSVRLNAPRLTFTNGQTSNIFVATQVAFVSDLTPVVSDSAVGFDPQLQTLSEGVRLVVEGTVSADRRYVTLNVDTSVSKIESFANVAVTAVAGGRLVNSADTQSFVQLPTVTVTSVATTVTVPDQGTILLGGQRLINEFDVEAGVPVLSKIPIINRFFSNRIKAKDEQTLLILIKPTILIQSEQEQQTFPGLLDSLRTPYSG